MDTKTAITYAYLSCIVPSPELERAWEVLESDWLRSNKKCAARCLDAMNEIARTLNDRHGIEIRPVMELI